MTGVVRLTATNTISSTYKDDDSQLYQWQNTTQNDLFKYVTSGCYVDTFRQDKAMASFCGAIVRNTTKAVFSAGDHQPIVTFHLGI
ncbi:hypothetical protein J5X91_08875 [Pseudoalteromonas sp. K222D]|uniref:hypothetical protein n=1 Tax=Pseudoalteromonas sp. K222D TaxID=2820756 RepID=UPI001AD6837C|nr:hypothetical protein [Pseudoalteromonas sp. K222D]MBO7926381.1 hypothetical protein [Pseudoalteromonas sp. K222D]